MRVNRSLARGRGAARRPDPQVPASCTRSWTRTTRRSPAPARCGAGYVAQKYAALIEALYGDRDHVQVEAQVTYEDGRTGTMRADVRDPRSVERAREAAPVSEAGARRCSRWTAISVRFGALQALNRVSLDDPPRRDRRHHRPQRRRQDHAAQRASAASTTPTRAASSSRAGTARACAPPDVAALGIARTFQNVALFKGMSVLDNIMTGRLLKMRGSFLLDALYWGPARRQELEHRAFVERIIDFLEIQAIRKTPAGTPALRAAEAGGAGPRAGRRAQAPAARRADGGHERRGEGGHVPLHPRRQRASSAPPSR